MQAMGIFDVVVIGRSCLDYIAVVQQFPAENQKAPLEFRLTEGGGQGGTASCCISRLGGKVAYVGRLGDDDEGRFCLKRLEDFGVGTEYIETVKGGKTPVSYVFVTGATGDRTIIFERNSLPKITVSPDLIKLVNLTGVILLDPEVTYLGRELKTLAGKNIRIVYDCERWRDGIEDMMAAADFFIPSAAFLESEQLNFDRHSIGRRMFRLKEMIHGELIVTNGEDGAYYLSGNRLYHVAAPRVNAIDTIGAGDNFHAAFALALSKGFDFDRSVKFSVAVASLSCRNYGGRKGIPDWKEAVAVADRLEVKPVDLPYSGCQKNVPVF